MLVGIISDTHDLLRPEAENTLRGVERIIHCGDVCNATVLESLRGIAPVCAVRGNCDHGPWTEKIPIQDTWQLDGLLIHAVHDLATLDLDPAAAGISLVLSGHTHDPSHEQRHGVTYFNPGSAGPRRFRFPVSLALLRIEGGEMDLELITLG